MAIVYCDTCQQHVDYKIDKRLVEEYKGCKVNVIENVGVCVQCNNEVFVEELEEENLIRLYDKYRELNNMVMPVDINTFRNRYNISQRDLVSILGWGKMTINRYERGALANKSHNDLLKLLISDEKAFFNKVEEAYNSGRLSGKKYKEIMKRKPENWDKDYREALNQRLVHYEDEYNGFRKFDVEKVENLISFLAERLNGIYLTSLNKLLFYIDFAYYKQYTRSITGLRYMRYTHGPVIEGHQYHAFLLLNGKYYTEEGEYNEKITTLIKSYGNYELSLFSEKELSIINKVIDFFSGYNAKRISDLSHEEDAWQKNKDGELISYNFAESLKVF